MLINYTENELDLLARLMRAEALGEGDLGMLMVGNVVINRALANCSIFGNAHSISEVIYQKNQFSGTKSGLFFGSATTTEKQLAKRVLNGETFYPATKALWFYAKKGDCQSTWYNQPLAGAYKNHCFYNSKDNKCFKTI